MAVFLPPLAAHLAKVAAKDEGRYCMTGVRVLDPGDGTYRLEATDGRRAVILRGHSLDASLVPVMPELCEDSGRDGVIPLTDWLDGFKMVPKEKGYGRRDLPLGIDLGKHGFGMGTCGAQRQGRLLDGRFPNIDSVLPKRPATVSFAINPKLMIDLLQAALAVVGDEPRVMIHYFGKDKPVGLTCHTSDHGGVFFDGLIMPLS
jgi:hypothetical protein